MDVTVTKDQDFQNDLDTGTSAATDGPFRDRSGEPPADDDLYRIGTVAQLTDISVERLRAWERRYGLEPAHRAGKTRFYTRAQVDHLIKIRRLIDNGHPIGSLAELSGDQLDTRLETHEAPLAEPVRAGLIGPNLLVLEQQQSESQRLAVCARWANMAAFEAEQAAAGELDAIVVQLPVLNSQLIDKIEKICPNTHIVALYQFATPGQISNVEERGLPTLKWPAAWRDIELAAASFPRRRRPGPSGRRFSDEELIAIAASALDDSSACPQHLVELISQLNAFEDYVGDCAREAEEPGLFGQIAEETAEARARLEIALEALAVAEGLIAAAR